MIDRIFIGVDPRQPIAFFALACSIVGRSSRPLTITPLILSSLPIKRTGLTEFTYSRFMVPWLCGYYGRALFLDADMMARSDIAELIDMYDAKYAVQVVQNKLRYEWPSLMLFNCEACHKLTPEYVENGDPFSFEWGEVGALPSEWNHLVGYDDPDKDAKLVHFTQGIPIFPETKDCEFGQEYQAEVRSMTSSVSWAEIMGNSVHAAPVLKRMKETA